MPRIHFSLATYCPGSMAVKKTTTRMMIFDITRDDGRGRNRRRQLMVEVYVDERKHAAVVVGVFRMQQLSAGTYWLDVSFAE